MNLNHIKVLVAVVEAGGFTKASEILSITQSGISHAIAGLEKELGIPLLVRDRQGVTLTEAGVRIFPHCKEILSRIEQIQEESYHVLHLQKGKIKIGSFPSAISHVLPKILASYQRKYPLIEIVLFEGTDQEVLGWLQERIIDIAFVTLPQSNFETVPVSKDCLYAVIHAEHPKAKTQLIELQTMINEPFIMSKGGCEPLITKVFCSLQLKPNIQYEVRDMTTILAMIREGLGWTIVPEKALPHSLENVAAIPLSPTVWRNIGIAFHPNQQSYAAKMFIEEAKETEKSMMC